MSPVLGLTGSLCSGKTTALRVFQKKGASVFDTDELVHRYFKKKNSVVYKKISENFPEAIEEGGICRLKLRNIVFSDYKKLKKLEEIVHPVVIEELKRWIEKERNKGGVAVAEVPLLFEKNLAGLFDKVILIYAPLEQLKERIRDKYKLSPDEVLKRLRLFSSLEEKMRKSDFVIKNDADFFRLEKEIDKIWERVKRG